MNFRQLEQRDLDFVAEHSLNQDVFKSQPEVYEHNYTLEHNGRILVIGGIKMLNKTTAIAWCNLTVFALDHVIETYRCMKTWTDEMCRTLGIHRLEANVEVGFQAGEVTVKHLGFDFEFRMKDYNDGKPADRYVKYYEVKQ
jgi:hypothetical protein